MITQRNKKVVDYLHKHFEDTERKLSVADREWIIPYMRDRQSGIDGDSDYTDQELMDIFIDFSNGVYGEYGNRKCFSF